MFDFLRRTKYTLRVDGHRVFRRWLRPIQEWSNKDCREYSRQLDESIRKTVTPEIWTLLTGPEPSENAEYQAYVASVRSQLIAEYGFQDRADQIFVGVYHYERLVIGFPARKGVEYPYYYRGIQLKPYEE